MEMTVHQQLDHVLNYFRRNRSHNSEDWQQTCKNISNLKEIIHKLSKDGYIEQREGIQELQLTIEGELFKGYEKEKRAKTISTNLQLTQTWVIVVGAFLTALGSIGLLIYEMVKTENPTTLPSIHFHLF